MGVVSKFLPDLFRTFWQSAHGKPLLCVWGSYPLLIMMLHIKKRLTKEKDLVEEKEKHPKKKEPSQEKKAQPTFWQMLLRILHVGFPSLVSRNGLYVLLYTLILCSRVWLTLHLAHLAGGLGSMMGKRNFKEMFLMQAWYGWFCYPAALTNSLMNYFEKQIALQLRHDLSTSLLDAYLRDNTYYSLILSGKWKNLDQMLTVDVAQFSSTLTNIYGHMLKPLLDVIVISHSLSKMLGVSQLFAFFSFFVINNFLLNLAKPNLTRFVVEKRKLEGVYRADHSRIHHFCEEKELPYREQGCRPR